ncbi:MAG TPA: YlxR family protein [Anaerolineaceae bacterium]|nr:YlxR family protein [Anaerolineaceae bacterium]
MTKKPQKRIKHVPQRTCIGCRTVLAKRELVRLVRTQEGVRVDATGKAAGRGAYVHNIRACWEQALKGPINHALRMEITPSDRERLLDYMNQLPEGESTEKGAESVNVID